MASTRDKNDRLNLDSRQFHKGLLQFELLVFHPNNLSISFSFLREELERRTNSVEKPT